MKQIYLIRHAKTNLATNSISDFDRTISKKGKNDLLHIGNRLKNLKVKPDLILSSPAKRAEKSAKILAQIIGYSESKIQYETSLYDSSYTAYGYLLDSLDNAFSSIFIVAHNPTLTEVARRFSGAIMKNMPTSSVVCLGVTNFRDIEDDSAKVLFFDYPNLKLTI